MPDYSYIILKPQQHWKRHSGGSKAKNLTGVKFPSGSDTGPGLRA